MGSDRVRDVEKIEPHLRGDVVVDRLRERVDDAVVAKPLFKAIVEPPRRVDAGHQGLHALRVRELLLERGKIVSDGVEQCLPGL